MLAAAKHQPLASPGGEGCTTALIIAFVITQRTQSQDTERFHGGSSSNMKWIEVCTEIQK